MNTIKIYLFIVMTVFFTTNSHAQESNTVDCSKDSLLYTSLSNYLDTIEARKMRLEVVKKIAFGTNREQDCFCDLLVYANLFDFLLDNGLDLEYNYFKTPYMINSTNMPPDSEYVINNKKNNRLNKIYVFYLSLKKDFEDNLVTPCEEKQSNSLETDVLNIIRYNTYSYPNTLKSILLTKNAESLLEKYYAEKKALWGEE